MPKLHQQLSEIDPSDFAKEYEEFLDENTSLSFEEKAKERRRVMEFIEFYH